MKRTVLKIITFVVVFIVAAAVAGTFMNKGNTDMTAEMEAASLPVISMELDGQKINQMHGYTVRMEEAYMRESITPFGETRRLSAIIDPYGQEIEEIFIEVRSIDGERLIENTQIQGAQREDGTIRLSFTLKDLIEKGKEYCLIIVLHLNDGREVCYYTRIIQADYELEEKLSFIRDFHNACYDAELLKSEYRKYLEPDNSVDNTTLSKVTIHSNVNQMAWAGLNVKEVSEPVVVIKEAAPQTCSAVLYYQVSYFDEGVQYQALVKEYFRIRQTKERFYLLDYERTMEQVFEENSDAFNGNRIYLGVAGTDIPMVENDGGNVVAFSYGGGLYSYSVSDSKMARLFSFKDQDNWDARTLYDNHDYKILQVDETGNVAFLVCGYMNRGSHEGQAGVKVCYYNSPLNMVEELAYLPYTKSPEVLQADMENLVYLNSGNQLYLMLDGNIVLVDLERMKCKYVAKDLSEDSYKVSASEGMAAWLEESDKYASTELVLMNFANGKQMEISAGKGNYIYPIGFMGEDLIYGLAAQENVGVDSLGDLIFPMYKIKIQSATGEILKVYDAKDCFVSEGIIEENQLTLKRVQLVNGEYQEISDDQIMNNEAEKSNQNYISKSYSETLQTVVQIAVRKEIDQKKVKIQTPKEVLYEGSRDILVTNEEERPKRCYVLGQDKVVDIFSNPAEAVKRANEWSGLVLSDDGSYVWKKERLYQSNQIMAITGASEDEDRTSLAVCLDTILQFNGVVRDSQYLMDHGKTVLEILEECLEEKQILDLKGCSLNMVLYYPDREVPVLAMLSDGSAVLITGFNEKNVVLMNPEKGSVYKMGMNDATQWFEENGNCFITYVP